jgi:anthranilate phosphoribosyltransferase
MAPLLADVFAARGDSVVVMRGDDGLDEFTTTAPTRLWIAAAGTVRETVLDAADLGIARPAPDALRGGDAPVNGAVARRLVSGEEGAVADAVVVNAAVALVAHAARRDPALVADDASLAAATRDGIERARRAIASGQAAAALDRWISLARSLKAAAAAP